MGSCKGSSVLWVVTVTHTYPNVKEGGGGQRKQTELSGHISFLKREIQFSLLETQNKALGKSLVNIGWVN